MTCAATTGANKRVVREFVDAINRQDWGRSDELVAPGFVRTEARTARRRFGVVASYASSWSLKQAPFPMKRPQIKIACTGEGGEEPRKNAKSAKGGKMEIENCKMQNGNCADALTDLDPLTSDEI
jgi:hypothetical protein